jgi:hypothetical protein
MRVVCKILGRSAIVVASFWPSRAFGISSGLTTSGALLSLLGNASVMEGLLATSPSLGIDSTFFGAFFAAAFSSEVRPWVRLWSSLQPLRENHLSANLPYTPFRCMTSDATLVSCFPGLFCPVTGSFTSVGAGAWSSRRESVTLGASSSSSLSESSSPAMLALLCR